MRQDRQVEDLASGAGRSVSPRKGFLKGLLRDKTPPSRIKPLGDESRRHELSP